MVLLLINLYLSPLLKVLEGWVSVALFLGAIIFSAFVAFWPIVPINQISKALPTMKFSPSAAKEINRSGDRLADHLAPVVLILFLVGILLLRTWRAL